MIFGRRQAAERLGAEELGYLQTHLGPEATAFLRGPEAGAPQGLEVSRLHTAFEAVRYVVEAYDDATAVAWLFGMNPALEDRAPAYVLTHGDSPEQWSSVLPAAMEFVETAR